MMDEERTFEDLLEELNGFAGFMPPLRPLVGKLRETHDRDVERAKVLGALRRANAGSNPMSDADGTGTTSETVGPITGELREYLRAANENTSEDWLSVSVEWDRVNNLCDVIDAVHRNLEGEYETLRRKRRRGGPYVLSIEPKMDWGSMADDLVRFADQVRGMGASGEVGTDG